jgi:hypothetical protein
MKERDRKRTRKKEKQRIRKLRQNEEDRVKEKIKNGNIKKGGRTKGKITDLKKGTNKERRKKKGS